MPVGRGAKKRWVGLFCAEMPEARFQDELMVATGRWGEVEADIDPTFLAVCAPGSVRVSALAPSRPCMVGGEVVGTRVVLRLRAPGVKSRPPARVLVTLSGLRRGDTGGRFPAFTAAQAARNTRFWNRAFERPLG